MPSFLKEIPGQILNYCLNHQLIQRKRAAIYKFRKRSRKDLIG